MPTDPDPAVAEVFQSYPPKIRAKLRRLRKLLLATAARTQGVGPITETLKWGEPAYLTEATKTGSTVRLGWKKKTPDRFGIYFNCNTSLVETFRAQFPTLKFEGNRALVFEVDETIPENDVCTCFSAALTYHKRARSPAKD